MARQQNKKGEKSKKLLRQEQLIEKLGDHFHCLESREIENLLNAEVITDTIREFEKSDCMEIDFKNIFNYKYKDKPLGEYIDSKVVGLHKKYSSESGTIANKVQFAKIASTKIDSVADISEEAKKLSEKIYEFIARNNS